MQSFSVVKFGDRGIHPKGQVTCIATGKRGWFEGFVARRVDITDDWGNVLCTHRYREAILVDKADVRIAADPDYLRKGHLSDQEIQKETKEMKERIWGQP